jgi:Fe2+ transport system protein FeoA
MMKLARRAKATSTAEPIRLSALAPGRTARLHTANLAPQDCALLKALGMTDRCVLRICKVGEPCIVQVQSTRIGLARSVADGIFVVPETAG